MKAHVERSWLDPHLATDAALSAADAAAAQFEETAHLIAANDARI